MAKPRTELEARFANMDWEGEEAPAPVKKRPSTPTPVAKRAPEPVEARIGATLRRFEYKDSYTNSNKFWEITLYEKSYEVHYGRMGSIGQTTVKRFSSSYEANNEYTKIVSEKIRKGYVEKPRR